MGRLTATPRCCKCDKNILIAANLLCEGLIVQHFDLTRCKSFLLWADSGLLGQELRQAFQVSTSIIVLWCLALPVKKLDGREPLNTKSLAQALLAVCINLRDREFVLGKGIVMSKLFVDWGESFAMATPGSEEFDESRAA